MKPATYTEPYEFDPARVTIGDGWFEYRLMDGRHAKGAIPKNATKKIAMLSIKRQIENYLSEGRNATNP